ncbi:MAG TPA: CU044_2847 family protein [Pilimelia sp.]|nr:CU044_2847 family protein [Pilimelia sp.]
MADLLRFESDHGTLLVQENGAGDLERVGMLDRVRPARERLEVALAQVRPAVDAALATVREAAVLPNQIEIEIGVTLTAEAGAVLARTATQGHLIVRLTWVAPIATDEP